MLFKRSATGCRCTLPATARAWAAALAAALALAAPSAHSALDPTPPTRLDGDLRCLLGVYALAPGTGPTSVVVNGLDGQPRGLRYTLSDGRFGDLKPAADGTFASPALSIRFGACASGSLSLTLGSLTLMGRRQTLPEQSTRFVSDGVELHGKLVLPAGGQAQAQALAVWVEGSNNNPASDDSVWPYALASRGMAVFVYDKRGTGASAGAPTSDFHARARDTAAAVQAAQRLAPGIARVGVIGGSQGGWVAPLAATLVQLDFVVAAFALADGPIAQDRAVVAEQLREAGFGEAAQREANELTAITQRVVRFGGLQDLQALDDFKSRHAGAPWLRAIQPRSYTGLLLAVSTEQIRAAGPAMAQGLPFAYEPGPVIESISPRQLWLLGGRDRQAPNAQTQRILREMQQRGRPISVAVFSQADHGLIESRPAPAGTVPAYAASVFDLTADWILQAKHPAVGEFITLERAWPLNRP
jgi:uncharacterized protein